MKPLIMVVAGPNTLPRIVMDILAAQGRTLAGYVQSGDVAWGHAGAPPLLGGEDLLDDAGFCGAHEVIVAVGSDSGPGLGRRVLAAGATVATVIHPTAIISPSASIGMGTVISAGVVVQMDATIGRYCVLNTACTVDHDDVIEDGVSISPGAHLAGGVHVRGGAFIGAGAVLVNRVTVGRRATVGAGAVVLKDVAEGATVVGNPARPIGR
jgi:sugar O-acyltransferase (sialic acid O-acetyltransferase NeuD family)